MLGFWIFMLIMTLLIPFAMIQLGTRFEKRPPSRINWVFGYRSARSMKNKDTWEFAHNCIGKLWHRIGLIMLAPSVIVMVLVRGGTEDLIGMVGGVIVVVQLVPMIVSVILTERALKNRFG